MSDLVITVFSDLSVIFLMSPFNYVTGTVILGCVIVLIRKLITV